MRNSTIDFARFVAAFFVVALHVGYYNDMLVGFGEMARISGRWAVPFFFMVTGYFIGIQGKEDKCHLQAFRVTKIFLISSLMYLPYCLVKDPNYLESRSIIDYIRSGTYFHLWFLSSLAVGLVSFQFLHKIYPKSLVAVSIGLIMAFVITDIAAYLENENVFTKLHGTVRHTISLAFIIIGYKISRLNFENLFLNKKFMFAILILFLAYFLEPIITQLSVDSHAIRRQFPVFTPMVTIAIMILCLKGNMNKSIFSEAGKNYSLGIYLVHPLFIPVSREIFTYFSFLPKTIQVLLTTFLLSWFLVSILMRKFTFLYRLLYGEFKLRQ
tara:strand:+ start:549 stop:1526 length:978 start_codon:yes stop_codon:yes gene_type:complete